LKILQQTTTPTVADDETPWDPYAEDMKRGVIMKIAELKFKYQSFSDHLTDDAKEIKVKLMSKIKECDMAPFYLVCSKEFGWNDMSESDLKEMQQRNADKIKTFDDKIVDAKENLGDNDVLDALMGKADYIFSIGDKDATVNAYLETKKKVIC
jgi:hypothetical protein